MKSVKKLAPETVIASARVSIGTAGIKTQRATTFAVCDESGSILIAANGQFEIYSRKATAQQVADYYNAK